MQIYTITPVYNATNIVAATTARNLVAVRGYFRGAADKWLQFHDAAALPSNGAVPLKSFQLMAQLDYFKNFDPTPLIFTTGIVICVSDTEGTLTISSSTADFLVDVEDTGFLPTGLSTAGDLVTPISVLTVWANGAGPKNLYSVTCVNNESTDCFLMLFPNLQAVNNIPLLQWPIAQGATLNLLFGNSGIRVEGRMALSTDTVHPNGGLVNGCYLGLSTTTPAFTKSTDQASYIKATYK